MGTEITKGEFQQFLQDENYEILKNSAKGDCFFESIAQLLFGDMKKHVIVRQSVCDFHAGFKCGAVTFIPFEDEFTVLSERSNKNELINNLKYLLLQDPDREDHSENVCNPKVYARDSETAAVCLLYKVNLKIFMEIGDKVSVFDLVYDNNAPTLNLHFVPGVESSDGGHYQAMKTGTTRRTTSRTTTQKKKTSKEVAKPKETKPKETKPKETKPKETKPKEVAKPKETKPKEVAKSKPQDTIFNKTLKKRGNSSEDRKIKAIKNMDLGVSSDEIRKAMKSAYGNPDKAVQSILNKLVKKK